MLFTLSLGQDVHGHIFYEDLVDKLLPNMPQQKAAPYPVGLPTTPNHQRKSAAPGRSSVEDSGVKRRVPDAPRGNLRGSLGREMSEKKQRTWKKTQLERRPTRNVVGNTDLDSRYKYSPRDNKRDPQVSHAYLKGAQRGHSTRIRRRTSADVPSQREAEGAIMNEARGRRHMFARG